jgi:RNA recognition motif-containing protein
MSKKIYVGNIPYNTTEDDLRTAFSEHGEVLSVAVIMDRETGRARGFAFVEMEPDAADRAIEALDQTDLGGRTLRVNEARSREGGGR